MRMPSRIQVIDSHTGGEPTRLVLSGGPDLGLGPLDQRRARFRDQFDAWRRAIVCEPRGSDVLVGALRVPPHEPGCVCGVIFFNNVGYLGMCGHATLGLLASLAHTGEIAPGRHRIDTPVGVVEATLHDTHRVSLANVVSSMYRKGVKVALPEGGSVVGDIAYGGNWFFLCDPPEQVPLHIDRIPELTRAAEAIRRGLEAAAITGANGAEIDHIEFTGPSPTPGVDARNFVLCPGLAYDRSPCGTGTSAKVACLAARGKLAPGQVWRQESIVGSVFEATYEPATGGVRPVVTGSAFVHAEASLVVNPDDPFAWGLSPG